MEQIANCALDMMDAGHRALMDPVTGKPIKISVSFMKQYQLDHE